MTPWLITNGADLIGHGLTLLTLIGGFIVIRSEMKADIAKDRDIKRFDRTVAAIWKKTNAMLTLRHQMYLLAIRPFDRQKPLTEDTEKRLEEIAKLQAEWSGTSLFIPPELRPCLSLVEEAFDAFTPAMQSGATDQIERANDMADTAIQQWRAAAQQWAEDNGAALA